ncbi:MAG: Na+/H+ antiporter NhaC [Pseudomonadales bacterium]|nr:Na+/H+ antiporter NhaC [Pseudomonadales bacterium]MDP4640692.1 Na+/H+ antiporter NhaC [Pseudomonadales bacterium]MDP5059954.1 Na+/H+ antiporter NhaC [Pseudomonadales bacterium]
MIKTPSFLHALVCFGVVVSMISSGLFVFDISLHSILFMALVWVAVNARLLGHSYAAIQSMMSEAISRALPAIYIFLLIGMVIASFMQSGTIATLIYYGLALLEPSLFLVTGLLLCCLMSVATGTSWGTVGTLGVVFMGIGAALNVPLALVAGMVVSGATFGDKLSPVSDTTNLAAMSAHADLYTHIRTMLYTTVPTLVLVMLILLWFGFSQASEPLPATEIAGIQAALQGHYGLNPLVTLLPLLVMVVLSVRRVSPQVAMTMSILTAFAIAVLYQGVSVAAVMNALWSNSAGTTGIANIDSLLGRGGISSMSWTLLLSVMALALGGVLFKTAMLEVLLAGLISRVKHTAGLIALTITSGFIGNVAMGEAYISIILNCQLFSDAYKKRGLPASILSRSVEEGSTVTTGLIPWTTAGAFYAVTLGVPVLDYLPYAFFNLLNPLVSVTMAMLGLGLLRAKGGAAARVTDNAS